MHKLINFDNWIEDTDSGKFGSGASEKIWLVNPITNERGLFKYPKYKNVENKIVTGEYWSEKLATEIAKLINIKCAKVDIGTYNGRIGSMSYNIIGKNEILSEGITFLQQKYPFYNKKKLIDEYSNEKYTLQMIEKCISSQDFNFILLMVIFDALIGNSDRHHSNWGIIYHFDLEKGLYSYFCPLYDNGSSLCAHENSENIEHFLKDSMRFDALINSKSKSAIGWDNIRPIKHFELIQNIRNKYYEKTIQYVKIIKDKVTNENIDKILENFNDEIINKEMKILIKKFIIARKNIILDIYNIKGDE